MLGVAKIKRARFLLTSTSEVYGDPEVHPQPESYWGNVNPIGPRGVYDEAKRYAEALTMAYHRQQGVDTRIARIFNTYGPRMRPHDGRAIPTFLRQALQDKPLTVFGDGSQTRSFCYVDDLIRGLVDADVRPSTTSPVNLGNPMRDDAAGAGRDGDRGDRLALGDRVRGAARRTTRRCASRTSRSRARCSSGSREVELRRRAEATIERVGHRAPGRRRLSRSLASGSSATSTQLRSTGRPVRARDLAGDRGRLALRGVRGDGRQAQDLVHLILARRLARRSPRRMF